MKRIVCVILLIQSISFVFASEWYRASPGGLALERMAKVAALRQEYALEVTDLELDQIPELLQSLESGSSRAIGEIVYHENQVLLRRYKLYNAQGYLTLASQINEKGYSWIERYDSNHRLIEELWSTNSEDWFKRTYTYYAGKISSSRTFIGNSDVEENLLYRDLYRYDRSGMLRAIERITEAGTDSSAEVEWFSKSIDSLAGLNRPGPGATGETISSSSVGSGNSKKEDGTIVYTLDSKGRVIQEVHRNEAGALVYERVNVWDQDRLRLVTITENGITQKIEYSYDAKGNRIGEKYYTNSELERQITVQGNQETEELYHNGQLLLRTIWIDGVKTSEERPKRPAIKP